MFFVLSDADNFEPVVPVVPVDIVGGAKLNKWEGEDEEENIKVRKDYEGIYNFFVNTFTFINL